MLPPIARRFVAGESPAAALEHARELNERDVAVILNLLGEHYDDPEPAEADAAAYRQLIDDIADADLDACVSIKPSQLGLDLGEDRFRALLEEVVARGAERDVFVWVDMEDHTTTDATLDAFEDLAREHWSGEGPDGGIGLCVQANLKRTREDVERLADVPGKVRFVKGAYDEPADVAYADKSRVNEAYRELLEYAFDRYDGGIAIGSHDPEMIDYAKELHEERGADFEVQMLMGVREDAQVELAAEGYEVWQYAPYGKKWKSYFWRRIRERKENLTFALRAILGR
ncbi:proline dehydrogenase family protein [Halovivax sp.]|uniref:proline dehydrogenase family protein n=1 Tax=Halovivax sp. TaxID=1935978 RepID=UPI0025B8FAF9|nr:proline dehydrogenase family protein [Halovivax sp.]